MTPVSEPVAYRKVVEALLQDPGVSETQMMGMPSLKVAGKLFAGLNGDALVVKVGKARADELIASGRAEPFDPSARGRPMKDWARLPEPAVEWLALAEEARSFVSVG
jgi:TfoX/Sxy family transcriptional regulator of competence genes